MASAAEGPEASRPSNAAASTGAGEQLDCSPPAGSELSAIRNRYERRKTPAVSSRYSMLRPAVYMAEQERERALIRWITQFRLAPLPDKRVLEVGCGHGSNALQLLRLGFSPHNVVVNELLEERARIARQRLPAAIQVLVGDASQLDLPQDSFDVVLQSTVFSSILDSEFQNILAVHLWKLVRPGGGVLWYDFIYDNPRNPDVRGVSITRIRQLFPEAQIRARSLTLAPPISRFVTRIHPGLYTWFRSAPFLRTHVLCWIRKTR
jgi:SAM-dependent methyltransferase